MAHINLNFDEVPDGFEPIPPGVYTFTVKELSLEPTSDNQGQKLVAVLQIDEPSSPLNGRTFRDHLSLKKEYAFGIKNLSKSCGVPVSSSGVNTEDLIGKTGRVRLKSDTYKDQNTGQVKETTRVAEYIVNA